MRVLILALSLVVPVSAVAKSLSVLEMENCIYSGKRLNRSIAKPTATETPKIPPKFTGKAVCYDVEKKKRSYEREIVNGKLNGWEIKFDVYRGGVAEETFFVNGLMSGTRRRYDHNTGKLRMEMEYRDGEQHGVQKDYFSKSGKLRRIVWISKPLPKKTTSIYFNEDGTLSMLECGPQVLTEHDSAWCGRDGKRGKVVLHGFSRGESWPREIRHYKNNVLDGERIKLNRKGEALSKEIYAKGESKSSESYKDGKVISFSKNKDGKRSGKTRVFFSGGKQLKIETTWKKGKKTEQKEFYEDGLPRAFYKYDKKGVKVTRFFGGKKYSEGRYKEKRVHWWEYWENDGPLTYYYENGKKKEMIPYKAGEVDGECRRFNESGKLVQADKYVKGTLKSSKYYRGKKVVREVLYNADGSVLREVVQGKTI